MSVTNHYNLFRHIISDHLFTMYIYQIRKSIYLSTHLTVSFLKIFIKISSHMFLSVRVPLRS